MKRIGKKGDYRMVLFYIIAGLWLLSKIGNIMVDVQGDWNRASQHKRDNAILHELQKMNSKDD